MTIVSIFETCMKYDFDQIIDRRTTNAMSVEGFEEYLFGSDINLNLPCSKEELLTMWVADMEFATAPEIVKAIKDRLDHGIFGYSKIFEENYFQSFSNWCKSRYGFEFQREHLLTSQGVIPALYDLIGYLCKPGEKLLTLTPSYGYFKHAANFNDRELVLSSLNQKGGQYFMDLEDISEKTSDPSVKLVILCNPHNPIGRVWNESELRDFAEICFENEVTIISDEIHCDLLRKGQAFTPLQKLFPDSDRIVTCMSPSKTFNLAGLMFANIIIPNESLRSIWHKKQIGMDNPLSIAAAQAAYSQGGEWLQQLSAYLDGNFRFLKDYLTKHLPKAKFEIPDATYLAWISVNSYLPQVDNLTLFFANQAGVILEGGDMFVSNADGYIRLNVACPRARLQEGLKRITMAILEATE